MDDPAEHAHAGFPAGEPGSTESIDVVAADIDAIAAALDGVDRALSRIDAAIYGRCGNCGGAIGDAVLADDPTREICEACAPPAAG